MCRCYFCFCFCFYSCSCSVEPSNTQSYINGRGIHALRQVSCLFSCSLTTWGHSLSLGIGGVRLDVHRFQAEYLDNLAIFYKDLLC